jgi:cyclohexyl-isocyanide hydratase
MDRRELLQTLLLTSLTASLPGVSSAAANAAFDSDAPKPKFVLLIHPGMVLLDLLPALKVFQLTRGDVQLVWKDRSAVPTDVGIAVEPTATLAEAFRDPDVLFIPGGLRGTVACMNDPEIVAFVSRTGNAARYVTSVCTGSLLLGAAGLLKGYRATGHWHSRYALEHLGATLSDERVVVDRNRITGGGVTAGLDFGLHVAALIRGEQWAKSIQLVLEYAPAPPLDAGTVAGAGPEVTRLVSNLLDPELSALDTAVAHAQERLKL